MTENGKRRCRGTARRHIAQAGTKAMKGTGIPQNITPESASPLPNRVCCHGFVKCLPIAHFWGLWRQRLAILCGAASLTVGGRVGERGPPIRLTRARGETSGGGVTRMSELGWCMCCYNMARSYKLRTAARQARRQPLRHGRATSTCRGGSYCAIAAGCGWRCRGGIARRHRCNSGSCGMPR